MYVENPNKERSLHRVLVPVQRSYSLNIYVTSLSYIHDDIVPFTLCRGVCMNGTCVLLENVDFIVALINEEHTELDIYRNMENT